jgi:predicted TPR repeat methyltransferase
MRLDTTVSLLTEIPEGLHEAVTHYLESHPTWDQDRLFAAALSLFLLQTGESDYCTAQAYLEKLFQQST